MAPNAPPAKRPRLAAVVTSYKKLLHPQQVVDRFLDGYGWDETYHRPQMDVVSLYVDQKGDGDLFQERADRHPGMKSVPYDRRRVDAGYEQTGGGWRCGGG